MTGRGKTLDCVCLLATIASGDQTRFLFLAPIGGVGVLLPICALALGEMADAALARLLARLAVPGVAAPDLSGPPSAREVTFPERFRGVLRATKLFDAPASDADGTGHLLSRGAVVQVLAPGEGFARVAAAADDLAAFWPMPAGAQGYVRRSLLTRRVRLHCYRVALAEPPATGWSPPGVRRQWLPVPPPMVPWQQGWLDALPG